MKEVIINADDLGASKATNKAIAYAYRHGVLTSASCVAAMPAYEDALAHVIRPNPELGVGMHLTVTEGKAILDAADIPLLVDAHGRFRNSFFDIWMKLKKNKDILKQIYWEMDAQCYQLHTDGIRIDHIDGHHHIHMIPSIFQIVAEIAKKYDCHVIRLTDEPLYLSASGWYPSYYYLPWINGNIVKKTLLSTFSKLNKKYLHHILTTDYFLGFYIVAGWI